MERAVAEWLEGMPPVRQKKMIIASKVFFLSGLGQ